MKKIAMLAAAILLVGATLSAQEKDAAPKPKTYTLVVEGMICGKCAYQVAAAIQTIEGAKVVTPPKTGTGARAESLVFVELNGKATLGAVTTAIEGAQTRHRDKIAPEVVTLVSGKLKESATPQAVMEALKKADILAE